MQTVSRYILGTLIGNFTVYSAVVTALFVLNYLYQIIRPLMTHRAPATVVLSLFLSLMPSVLSISLPVTFVLALMLTVGQMREHGEIAILNTMGVRRRSFCAPLLLVALVISVLMLPFNAYTVPRNYARFRSVLTEYLTSSPLIAFSDGRFLAMDGHRVYAERVTGDLLSGVYLFIPHDTGTTQILTARHATVGRYDNASLSLTLRDGILRTADPNDLDALTLLSFATYTVILTHTALKPATPVDESARSMDSRRLRAALADVEPGSDSHRVLASELFLRPTLSFAPFSISLLAVVLALRFKRNARSLSFIGTIALLGVYYFLVMGCLSVAQRLPSPQDAMLLAGTVMQLPNALFIGAGLLAGRVFRE